MTSSPDRHQELLEEIFGPPSKEVLDLLAGRITKEEYLAAKAAGTLHWPSDSGPRCGDG